jgi:hypothetical protein
MINATVIAVAIARRCRRGLPPLPLPLPPPSPSFAMANAPFPPSSLPQFFCLLRVDCCFDTSASPPLRLSASVVVVVPLSTSSFIAPSSSSSLSSSSDVVVDAAFERCVDGGAGAGAGAGALSPPSDRLHRDRGIRRPRRLHRGRSIVVATIPADGHVVAVIVIVVDAAFERCVDGGAPTSTPLSAAPVEGGGAIEDVKGNIWV